MHGAQFDNYNAYEANCLGRTLNGISNMCASARFFALGVTKMNDQASNYTIWVDGWHGAAATTTLYFSAYGWDGSFRRQIVRDVVTTTVGSWNSNAVLTAAEAQNGYLSIVALIPANLVGSIFGVGIYQ
jgi:hypothetical protein